MMRRMAIGLPPGFRPMTAEECEALTLGDRLAVLDAHTGDVHECHVYSWTECGLNVRFLGSQHIEFLDVDNPDFWPDAETRERKAPTSDDGQYVAVARQPAAPVDRDPTDSDLFGGGESQSYRDAMIDSGRGHLLR